MVLSNMYCNITLHVSSPTLVGMLYTLKPKSISRNMNLSRKMRYEYQIVHNHRALTLYGPKLFTLQVNTASLPMATDWLGIVPTNSGFPVFIPA